MTTPAGERHEHPFARVTAQRQQQRERQRRQNAQDARVDRRQRREQYDGRAERR